MGFVASTSGPSRSPRLRDGKREVRGMTCSKRHGAQRAGTHDKRLEAAFLRSSREGRQRQLNRLVIAAGDDWRTAATLRPTSLPAQLGSPSPRTCDTLASCGRGARPDGAVSHALRSGAQADVRRDRCEGHRQRTRGAGRSSSLVRTAPAQFLTCRWLRATNFFSMADGKRPSRRLKVDSNEVDAAPQPRPYREIWVY